MSLSITDVKQLLGQGLRTDSASNVNPDSVDCVVPEETGDTLRIDELSCCSQFSASYDYLTGEWLLTIKSENWRSSDLRAVIDKSMREPGSEDCGPSAPVDQALPKEVEFFSTHLKRTGDLIDDY